MLNKLGLALLIFFVFWIMQAGASIYYYWWHVIDSTWFSVDGVIYKWCTQNQYGNWPRATMWVINGEIYVVCQYSSGWQPWYIFKFDNTDRSFITIAKIWPSYNYYNYLKSTIYNWELSVIRDWHQSICIYWACPSEWIYYWIKTPVSLMTNSFSEVPLWSIFVPNNLKQQIQSPQHERQLVEQWEKIWKYQSGSWLILSADIWNKLNLVRLAVEIYKVWDKLPTELLYSNYWSWEVVVPYLWSWSYYWRVRTEDKFGQTSKWVNFWSNDILESDYLLYEWFEPYPYWYRFPNNIPNPWLLNWWIANIGLSSNWEYENSSNLIDFRQKINWNRWDILFAVYPESSFASKEVMFDVFESMWLDRDIPYNDWSCFWLSLSASMQYKNPLYMDFKFNNFYNQIWTWFIWDKIDPINTDLITWKWDQFNTTAKTIFAFQLYQYSKTYNEAEKYSFSILTATGILNEIKNNPKKTYILTLYWKKDWKDYIHSVVPYKTEGNKIYIWDNSYPFTNSTDYHAYNQYIQVDKNWKWVNPTYKRDFTKISLVDIADITTLDKSLPIWFNKTDTLFTFSWSSDLVLLDSFWRISWFLWWTILEEIPWVKVFTSNNAAIEWETTQNKWKQIYLPQKQDLIVKVIAKWEEIYDLMIAWWDYYTKIASVETSTWQIDTFKSLVDNIKIDFDDNKTWDYDLLIDNFQENSTWTIYIDSSISIPNSQEYIIDWQKVKENTNDSVSYKIDTNNDSVYDTITLLPSIFRYNKMPQLELQLSYLQKMIKKLW